MKKILSFTIGTLILSLILSPYSLVLGDDFEPADEELNAANTLILDADDTGGDVTLQFGTSLAEYLEWDNANLRFDFSDDLRIEGDLETGGTSIVLDADNTGSGANVSIIANQGSDSDGELRYNATSNEWEISNDGSSFTTIPTSSGSAVTIQDEGIDVTNTPHSTLNFTGAGVIVTDGGSGVATITIAGGGGTSDLDSVYDSDTDKQMDVDDTSGLSFDLTTTGDLNIEDSGTAFFTFYNDSDVTYTASATGAFTIDGSTTRTGNTPLLNLTGNFDTTTAGDTTYGTDMTITRASGDTGQSFGQYIELNNNSSGEGYGLNVTLNQNNSSSTSQNIGISSSVSGNGDAGEYGGFMAANSTNTSTGENAMGVIGSGTAASSDNAGIGGYFSGENTSTGYAVGVFGQAVDDTGVNTISAGGAFISMQEIDSTLSSSIVAMGASETSSGIPTDFGVLIRDYIEAGLDEGFITGIGITPTTLTTGMLIQPPSGSTYTTGIDIDNSQGGTVTTGIQIDAGTNAIFVDSGNTIIDTTDSEAFLVRQNGDSGDVFAVDTTNSTANLYQNSLVVTLTAGETISAGDVVKPGSSNLQVVQTESTYDEETVGVAVTGGTTGETIQVAIAGLFEVTVDTNVAIGAFLEPANTDGRARSSGTSGGSADFGIALTSGSSGGTVIGVFKKGEVY